MVEMLGVLAIIGVLSVGAIAGYSKAMVKYKLNKQAEQLNQIFNGITQYYRQFNSTTDLLNILKKLNIIPLEMIKDNSGHIYDVFNNQINVRAENCSRGSCSVFYYFLNTDNNQEFAACRNIINTVKENSANLYYVELLANYGAEGESRHTFLGDAYCRSGNKCLKNISLTNMDDMCTSAKGKRTAHLKVWWKNN